MSHGKDAMTPPDETQRTIGGLAAGAVGRAREALANPPARESDAKPDGDSRAVKPAGDSRDAEPAGESGSRAAPDRLADQVAAEQQR